jgi:two-component system chemotaxis response regulator CheY
MLKRIMIVDDDSMTRSMLRDILESGGHTVVAEASSGAEVVAIYRESMPDVVIMDIVLPDKNGIDATGLIRSLDKSARIIILSALGDIPIIKAAFAVGAVDFIHKPFTPARILEAIRQAA